MNQHTLHKDDFNNLIDGAPVSLNIAGVDVELVPPNQCPTTMEIIDEQRDRLLAIARVADIASDDIEVYSQTTLRMMLADVARFAKGVLDFSSKG